MYLHYRCLQLRVLVSEHWPVILLMCSLLQSTQRVLDKVMYVLNLVSQHLCFGGSENLKGAHNRNWILTLQELYLAVGIGPYQSECVLLCPFRCHYQTYELNDQRDVEDPELVHLANRRQVQRMHVVMGHVNAHRSRH